MPIDHGLVILRVSPIGQIWRVQAGRGEANGGRRHIGWVRMGMLALRITLFAFVLALAAGVDAHVNDRGMDYRKYKDTAGIPCCSKEDCHPAEKFLETVEDGQEVVRLLIDGEWITVPRIFLVPAPATDGRAHWCGIKLATGNPRVWRPGTRCIILPPRVL